MPPKAARKQKNDATLNDASPVTEAWLVQILDSKLANLKESIIDDLHTVLANLKNHCSKLYSIVIRQQSQINYLESMAQSKYTSLLGFLRLIMRL